MAKAVLDDPNNADTAVAVVDGGGQYADAAKAVGISRQAFHKYLDNHPEFRARIEAARFRAKELAGRLPALFEDKRVRPPERERQPTPAEQAHVAKSVGVPVDMVMDVDRLPGLSAYELLLEVERIALDGEHRAAARAMSIICELKFGKMVRAQQRQEARLDALASAESVVSQDDGAAIIELPVNDTEAPGRAPRPVEAGVLEAEVVDRG